MDTISNKSQSTFELPIVYTLFHNTILDAMLESIPSEFHLPLVVVESTTGEGVVQMKERVHSMISRLRGAALNSTLLP